jgi:hypothetical protein
MRNRRIDPKADDEYIVIAYRGGKVSNLDIGPSQFSAGNVASYCPLAARPSLNKLRQAMGRANFRSKKVRLGSGLADWASETGRIFSRLRSKMK